MQTLKSNLRSFDSNSGIKVLHKSTMICMDSVQLVGKCMQKESFIIKEIRSNLGAIQGQEVKVYSHSSKDSLLVEVADSSKNIEAIIYVFSLSGKLLQMVNVSAARTVVTIPATAEGKYLMNVQIANDVSTWKITKG